MAASLLIGSSFASGTGVPADDYDEDDGDEDHEDPYTSAAKPASNSV